MKRYMDTALVYAIIAMVGGVFYREFTKGFVGQTALRAVHGHYFALGVAFFILLLLLERAFSFSNARTKRVLLAYHIGLNVTGAMLVARGVVQVLGTPLSHGMDAAISGIAGLGHIVLGVSLVLLLVQVRSAVASARQ